VSYMGQVVETALAEVLFARKLHPYTATLISTVALPDTAVEQMRRRIILQGELPSAMRPPSGCRFRTRCPVAAPCCAAEASVLAEAESGHFVACHFRAPCGHIDAGLLA
jgi:oligopeptide/dipeptide ABC transporter ATP-binding protein